MTQSLGNNIADALHLSLAYSKKLQEGVTSANFARFAAPGGQPVTSNHPAFIFGHLSLYAPVILEQLGRSDLSVAVPEGFEKLFSKDAQCVDDVDGSIYPPMESVVGFFEQAYDQLGTAFRSASQSILQLPNPSEGRMAELFPTVGSMHAFYVGGHMMLHLGQLSAWRRMQGLGPA